jgi:hypothetical protein
MYSVYDGSLNESERLYFLEYKVVSALVDNKGRFVKIPEHAGMSLMVERIETIAYIQFITYVGLYTRLCAQINEEMMVDDWVMFPKFELYISPKRVIFNDCWPETKTYIHDASKVAFMDIIKKAYAANASGRTSVRIDSSEELCSLIAINSPYKKYFKDLLIEKTESILEEQEDSRPEQVYSPMIYSAVVSDVNQICSRFEIRSDSDKDFG